MKIFSRSKKNISRFSFVLQLIPLPASLWPFTISLPVNSARLLPLLCLSCFFLLSNSLLSFCKFCFVLYFVVIFYLSFALLSRHTVPNCPSFCRHHNLLVRNTSLLSLLCNFNHDALQSSSSRSCLLSYCPSGGWTSQVSIHPVNGQSILTGSRLHRIGARYELTADVSGPSEYVNPHLFVIHDLLTDAEPLEQLQLQDPSSSLLQTPRSLLQSRWLRLLPLPILQKQPRQLD